MFKSTFLLVSTLLIFSSGLPEGFVYLRDIDNSILQEMRYFTNHNFVGRPITGYNKPECILTDQAAKQLSQVQKVALSQGYTLKVWDCYRPQKAVDDFYQWAQNSTDSKMKNEFYPRLEKHVLFDQGYIALNSKHTRGSTVDLTLVKLPPSQEEVYHEGDQLRSCFAQNRFHDNSIDMGTGFDCLDPMAWIESPDVTNEQHANRKLLQLLMQQQGFGPYDEEWWHFFLIGEPFPQTYFNFDIE